MSIPILGRNALLKINAMEIGYCEGLTIGIDADRIKEYKIGSQKPQVLEPGNLTIPWKATLMYVDKTYANYVLSGTKFTMTVQPSGTGDTYTLSNCLALKWDQDIRQNGVILSSVSGEAMDITLPT